MAISDFEIDRIEKKVGGFVKEKRPPKDIRHQLDINYEISGQSFIISEVRPVFDNPKGKIQIPIAKATYVKSTKKWKLYWMRANSKWNSYPPCPESKKLETILMAINDDIHGCFWG